MAASPRLAPVLRPRTGWPNSLGVRVRPDLTRFVPLSLVGLAAVFNLWVLRAETTVVMNVNDSAFHAAMIRWARSQIDQGHVPLDGWYANLGMGFPLFHHYQSLPAILAAYISLLASPAVLLTWSLYLLLALWPVSVYLGARWLGWDSWAAGVAALVSPLLVSVSWYGFEHSSFTWRGLGMWSALWGMWLLPLAWGLSWRAVSGKGSYALAALTVALTIACHFLTGYLALLALGVWFFARPSLWRAIRAAAVGVGAVLIAAWAIVPLVGDSAWAINSEYIQGTFWLDSYGAPKVLGWLFTGQVFDNGRFPIISLLVGIGLLVCLARFLKDERARALVGIFTLSLLLFFGRPTLGPLLKLLPGSDDLLLHRYIMGVHLAGIFLAGVGVAWLARQAVQLGRRFASGFSLSSRGSISLPLWARTAAGALAVAAVAVVGLSPAWQQVAAYDEADTEFIPAQQVEEQTDGADLATLLDKVRTLGGGRVYAGSAANWGGSYRIGSVPVYSVLLNQGMDASGFTLRVPSLLADTEVRFDESNPAQYDLFNLRYLILPADRVPAVPATVVAIQGRHRLWQVQTSGYFEVVDTIGPAIVADRYNIGRQMAAFLKSNELTQRQFPTVAYGGRAAAVPTLAPGASVQGPAGTVAVESSSPNDGVFRADVVATRLAAVLLKSTYDPRWKVTLDGVEVQPEMVAPGLVAATVTPGRHSIEFRYVPYSGYPLLFGLGLVTLVGLLFGRRFLELAPLRLLIGSVSIRRALPGSMIRLVRQPAAGRFLRALAVPRTLLPTAAVVFITAWAVRSLVVMGADMLDERYTAMLTRPPSEAQATASDAFAQSLLKINSTIPPQATVLVFWQVHNYFQPLSYGFYWSTFWLYPRQVTVSDRPDDALYPTSQVVVQVRSGDQQRLTLPGYSLVSEDPFPSIIISTYERSR